MSRKKTNEKTKGLKGREKRRRKYVNFFVYQRNGSKNFIHENLELNLSELSYEFHLLTFIFSTSWNSSTLNQLYASFSSLQLSRNCFSPILPLFPNKTNKRDRNQQTVDCRSFVKSSFRGAIYFENLFRFARININFESNIE